MYKEANYDQMIHCMCFAEGVEILCLLDKVLNACKYLQTYDQWQQAAWLAKVRPRSLSLLQSTVRYPIIINVYENSNKVIHVVTFICPMQVIKNTNVEYWSKYLRCLTDKFILLSDKTTDSNT